MKVIDLIHSNKKTAFSFEILPPLKGTGIEKLYQTIDTLREFDPKYINITTVEAHYGVKPILYTSYKFKKRYLSDSIFNAYPYWIAHYYVDSVRYEGKWHFWQHTDVGTVPGIEEEVDLNVFNGTMEELLELTLKTPCIER